MDGTTVDRYGDCPRFPWRASFVGVSLLSLMTSSLSCYFPPADKRGLCQNVPLSGDCYEGCRENKGATHKRIGETTPKG
jgi:hypothetical protein